eukprot:7220390-Alexandrium_andersonii.AAC.1
MSAIPRFVVLSNRLRPHFRRQIRDLRKESRRMHLGVPGPKFEAAAGSAQFKLRTPEAMLH